MTTNILFLCPHAAAKSVLAMVRLQQRARELNLDVAIQNAGTEPDQVINPKVAAHLLAQGVELADFVPPLLTDEALAWADHVISIGCISAETIPTNTRYHDWSDVPSPSANFDGAVALINDYTDALSLSLRD